MEEDGGRRVDKVGTCSADLPRQVSRRPRS